MTIRHANTKVKGGADVTASFLDDSAVEALPSIAWSASLRTAAYRFDNQPAVTDGQGQCLTYRELCDNAHRLAKQLVASHGVGVGMPVATVLPNTTAAVIASYAIRLTGAIEVPISWRSTAEEIAWCAKLAKVSLVLSLASRQETLETLALETVCLDEATAVDAGAANADATEAFEPVPGGAPARILFTSGTTGKPKGVLYRHMDRWTGEQMLKASLPFVPAVGDKIVLMTPFVHGASLMTYAWCDLGGHVILLDGVALDKIAEQLADPKLRAIFAPPTVLAKITSAFEGQTFKQVDCIFTGTQPLTALMYQRACSMFGPVVRVTYGKSECVNPITVLSTDQTHDYFSSSDIPAGACVGHPAPGVQIRIEPQNGADEQEGSDREGYGEIWLKAPHMSRGMITVDGFSPHEPGGWHQTGDLGYMDESGRLVLTGRLADVIKTGGFKVNPDEIEATLVALDASTQISVTALPSDYWGEIIVAVAESSFEGWESVAQARVAGLSRHKHPRLFVAVQTLPRNPQGKVSRRLVREQVLAQYELLDGPYPELKRRSQSQLV